MTLERHNRVISKAMDMNQLRIYRAQMNGTGFSPKMRKQSAESAVALGNQVLSTLPPDHIWVKEITDLLDESLKLIITNGEIYK